MDGFMFMNSPHHLRTKSRGGPILKPPTFSNPMAMPQTLDRMRRQENPVAPAYNPQPPLQAEPKLETEGEGEDLSREELKRELPNVFTINQIFEFMQNFTIESKKTPNLDYKADSDDQALEANIKLIFTEKELWNLPELKEILENIVKYEDPLMHPDEKKKLKTKMAKALNKGDRKVLRTFYPHLIALMFAVYCHVKRYSKAMIVKSDNALVIKQQIMKTWDQVFNDLALICNVIIYANKKTKEDESSGDDEGFLSGLPQSWGSYIRQQRKKDNRLRKHELELEEKIIEVNKKIIEMESELNAIKTKYEEEDAIFRQLSTEKENIKQQIYAFVNVKRITDENKGLMLRYKAYIDNK